MRRIARLVYRAANLAVRNAKRWGYQIYWINNCGDIGVKVWCMRNQFVKGIGVEMPDLDSERCDFYIPRQYNSTGTLIFPVVIGSSQVCGIGSRVYDPTNGGKLYVVEGAYGDAEGIDVSAVIRCTCKHSKYNPFAGSWTPTDDNVAEVLPMSQWFTITTDTNAAIFCGYFIDASANAVTLTLPSNPFRGYEVQVRVIDRTNLITIASTDLVEGDTTLTIPVQATNSSFKLTYCDPSRGGWVVTSEVN